MGLLGAILSLLCRSCGHHLYWDPRSMLPTASLWPNISSNRPHPCHYGNCHLLLFGGQGLHSLLLPVLVPPLITAEGPPYKESSHPSGFAWDWGVLGVQCGTCTTNTGKSQANQDGTGHRAQVIHWRLGCKGRRGRENKTPGHPTTIMATAATTTTVWCLRPGGENHGIRHIGLC